ncbi:hypothetical protein ACFLZ8_02350, partial [Planctomycetota bacterium]
VIKVIFQESTGGIGAAEREFKVLSNDKEHPEFLLSTTAQVVARLACEPLRLKLFLDEENAGCPEFTIKSLDGKSFSITELISTGNCITADLDPSLSATEFTLDLKVDLEKLVDNKTGTIQITLTHPEGDTATIPFNVLPKYTVNPQGLNLFNRRPQESERITISVINNYNDNFEVESITSENNTLNFISQSKDDNICKLEVDIIPPEQNGNVRFIDTYTIQIKDGPQHKMTCMGYYDTR